MLRMYFSASTWAEHISVDLFLDLFVYNAHYLGTIFIFNFLHWGISKKSHSSSL